MSCAEIVSCASNIAYLVVGAEIEVSDAARQELNNFYRAQHEHASHKILDGKTPGLRSVDCSKLIQ